MATDKGDTTKPVETPSAPQQATPSQPQVARPEVVSRPQRPGYGPFALVRKLFDDIEQLWQGALPAVTAVKGALAGPFVPAVDVSRRGDNLVATIDLPGMAADDIEVYIGDGALIVAGERHDEHEARGGDRWQLERSYGRFERTIQLPEGADLEAAEARFENGVLEITVRAPEARPQARKLEINRGSTKPESH
jgi:HSP20 family protein